VDLRRLGGCFPYLDPRNQGSDVSCVAEAFAAALYCLKAQQGLVLLPSSELLYPRVEELYSAALQRSEFPRRGTSFTGVLRELLELHGEDLRRLDLRPLRLQNDVEAVREALRSLRPVVAGYQVNEEIERFHGEPDACRRYGYVLPSFSRSPWATGGHAVLLVGYEDAVQCMIARNSWGPHWGVDGHFLIRYSDLEDPSAFTDITGFSRRT
jgi:hypothetical protein